MVPELKMLHRAPAAAAGVRAWGPEIELLLACARRRMTSADIERATRAVAAGVDWPLFLACARAHRLVPLAHVHASAGCLPVPPDVAAALRELAAKARRRSLLLTRDLVDALGRLASAGIPALPLKGPVLAAGLFGSAALRQINDLDILVREADVDRAVDVLALAGYRLASGEITDTLGAGFHHRSLISAAGTEIELHHRLIPERRAHRASALDRLLPRTRVAVFEGRQVVVLRDEELFVYLCLHGAGHAWSRLQWVADIAQLLRDGGVQDWDRVRTFAAALGGGRRVDAARHLAGLLFPDVAPAASFHPAVAAANRRVVSVLGRAPARRTRTMRDEFEYQLRTDAGVLARLRRMASVVFQPQHADVAFARLPRWATPLYAVLRPLRLVGRGLARAARRATVLVLDRAA